MTNRSDKPARRGIDPINLVIGLGVLFVAAVGISGDTSWVPDIDFSWVLAAGAVLVGMLMLIGSIRRPRTENHGCRDTGPTP